MQRREFLRTSARQAAAAAIPLAGAAAVGGADLYAKLSDQLGHTAEVINRRIDEFSASLGTLSERVDWLELRYRLVMALLVLSLLIDGGMSWMILTTPVPAVV